MNFEKKKKIKIMFYQTSQVRLLIKKALTDEIFLSY